MHPCSTSGYLTHIQMMPTPHHCLLLLPWVLHLRPAQGSLHQHLGIKDLVILLVGLGVDLLQASIQSGAFSDLMTAFVAYGSDNNGV